MSLPLRVSSWAGASPHPGVLLQDGGNAGAVQRACFLPAARDGLTNTSLWPMKEPSGGILGPAFFPASMLFGDFQAACSAEGFVSPG